MPQFHVRAGQQVIELLGLPGADQDGSDGRVGPDERGGQVRQRHSRLGGHLGELGHGLRPESELADRHARSAENPALRRYALLGTLMTTLFAVAEIDVAPEATRTDVTAVRLCPSPTCPTWLTPHA
jgi:hypothetical protein